MTDLVTINPSNHQLPAHLQSVQTTTAAVLADQLGGASFARLGRNNMPPFFKVVEGGEAKPFQDAATKQYYDSIIVCLFALESNVRFYYKGKYDPAAEQDAPDCMSKDSIHPDSDVTSPQSFLCSTCQWSVFGSNDRKGRACTNNILASAIIPAPGWIEKIMQFKISPGDMKRFKAYLKGLDQAGYPLEYTYTQISFFTEDGYAGYNFNVGGFCDEQQVAIIQSYIADAETNDINTMLHRNKTAMTRGQYSKLTGEALPEDPNPANAAPPVQAQQPAPIQPAVMQQPAPAPAPAPVQQAPVQAQQPAPVQPAVMQQPAPAPLQQVPATPVMQQPAPAVMQQPAPAMAPVATPPPAAPTAVMQQPATTPAVAPQMPPPVAQTQLPMAPAPAPTAPAATLAAAPQPQAQLSPEQSLDAAAGISPATPPISTPGTVQSANPADLANILSGV